MEKDYLHTLNAFPLPSPFCHFNIINRKSQRLAPHRFHVNLITDGSIKVKLADNEFVVTEDPLKSV